MKQPVPDFLQAQAWMDYVLLGEGATPVVERPLSLVLRSKGVIGGRLRDETLVATLQSNTNEQDSC